MARPLVFPLSCFDLIGLLSDSVAIAKGQFDDRAAPMWLNQTSFQTSRPKTVPEQLLGPQDEQ